MRSFSPWEKEIVNELLRAKQNSSVKAIDFLNSFFFKNEFGRALILQTQSKYAVYFLKVDLFDAPDAKSQEITKFLDLLVLLKFLNSNGNIAIYKNDKGKEKSMYFLQDTFLDPQPSTGSILLNTFGDYTSAPDTIHDKNKKIIYKGVVFENDSYELILGIIAGSLIISDSLKDIIPIKEDSIQAEAVNIQRSKKDFLLPTTLLVALLVLLLLIWFSIKTHQMYSVQKKQLSSLLASHQVIQNNIDQLTKRNKNQDSSKLNKERQRTDTVWYGVDVSKWNGNIKADLNLMDSISFVICKATEGIDFIDPEFSVNWNLLKQRKLIRGAYHFFHANDDPIRQAELFIEVIKRYDPSEMVPIVDIEQTSLPIENKLTSTKIQVDLLLFLSHLERNTGSVAMIYTSKAFANEYLNNETFAKYPLWLAEYSTARYPSLPVTWKEKSFKVWQKSSSYSVQSKLIDLDVFFGKIEELLK